MRAVRQAVAVVVAAAAKATSKTKTSRRRRVRMFESSKMNARHKMNMKATKVQNTGPVQLSKMRRLVQVHFVI